jgi:tetratricopeptide (TPR) repeat protein
MTTLIPYTSRIQQVAILLFAAMLLFAGCQHAAKRATQLHNRGIAARQSGNVNRAARCFNRATHWAPSDAPLLFDAAAASMCLGRSAEANNHLQQLPCDADCKSEHLAKVLTIAGIHAFYRSDRRHAVRYFGQAYNTIGLHGIVNNTLCSVICSNLGVATLFDQSPNGQPGGEKHYDKIHLRDYERAIRLFEQAIGFDSSNCVATYNLAVVGMLLQQAQDTVANGYIPIDSSRINEIKSALPTLGCTYRIAINKAVNQMDAASTTASVNLIFPLLLRVEDLQFGNISPYQPNGNGNSSMQGEVTVNTGASRKNPSPTTVK